MFLSKILKVHTISKSKRLCSHSYEYDQNKEFKKNIKNMEIELCDTRILLINLYKNINSYFLHSNSAIKEQLETQLYYHKKYRTKTINEYIDVLKKVREKLQNNEKLIDKVIAKLNSIDPTIISQYLDEYPFNKLYELYRINTANYVDIDNAIYELTTRIVNDDIIDRYDDPTDILETLYKFDNEKLIFDIVKQCNNVIMNLKTSEQKIE